MWGIDMARNYTSWGRYPERPQKAVKLGWADDTLPGGKLLPYGNGRSQGDVCLNSGGTLLDMRGLNRFIRFDRKKGLLTAEAGVTLREIINVIAPEGWMLPVTPGTSYVTLGGAIGNNVHGKNHHRLGSFGDHVTELVLRRSDGSSRTCKAGDAWFRATVGGMGLTGLITQATVKLMPIPTDSIDVELVRTKHIHEFFDLADESDRDWDYSIYWIDGAAPREQIGRGWFERGRWSQAGGAPRGLGGLQVPLPFRPPLPLVNKLTSFLFCRAWYWRPRPAVARVGYGGFLFPLDVAPQWPNFYGPRGFLKFQCVLPRTKAKEAVVKIWELVGDAGETPMISTMKLMRGREAAGLLSFPREGVSMTVEDLPYRGVKTQRLIARLEEVVLAAGGALYPAKDASMSGKAFKQSYPRWKEFLKYKDENMVSDLWQRVMGDEA